MTADLVQRRSGFLHALTTPLPRHLVDFREPARTLLLFVALVVTLATVWLPQPAPVRTTGVLLLAAAVALTAVCSLLPAFHPLLNRVGGLVVLAQITTLVALTGGEASLYTPLYIMLLLYAAIFYGPVRLLATGAVVTGAMLLPFAYGAADATYATAVLIQAPVWIVTTATVHWLVARIRRSAQTDGLTGLWNHVTFWQLLHAEHDRAVRYGTHYSVLLLDLDHFKQVNDTRGHPAGDEVLRTVAEILLQRCRASDVVGRYGGEEFALILPETSRETAVGLARELRGLIAARTVPIPVTASIGVAYSGDAYADTPEELLEAADRALYMAKRAGRNHVAVALPPAAVAAPAPA